MFLIYHHHLQESYATSDEISRLHSHAEAILGRSFSASDFEYMAAYGMEAFAFAALNEICEKELSRGWKRMNRLYNLFLKGEVDNSEFVRRQLVVAEGYFIAKKYRQYSATIDKIINFLEHCNKKNYDFFMFLQDMCPFLKKLIEKKL